MQIFVKAFAALANYVIPGAVMEPKRGDDAVEGIATAWRSLLGGRRSRSALDRIRSLLSVSQCLHECQSDHFTGGETCPRTRFSLAEITVLVGSR